MTASSSSARSLARAALPVVAIAVFVLLIGAVVASAGETLGYDFRAYRNAAVRVVDGQPLYDPSVDLAGRFGVYLYPPPFVLAILPFALVGETVATWLWLALLVAALIAGIALLPVRSEVRWVTLLLAGLSWPVAYSIKLGQVGPLLFLCFAVGWRWLERPVVLGVSAAAGTLIKIQPGLILAWAALRREWRTVGVGAAVIVGACLIVTPLVGLAAWGDYVELLRRVSAPVTTPHNFTPGAIAYQLGASETVAQAIQVASIAVALGAVVYGALRTSAVQGYLATVVAGQIVSPLLWDHYAMLLLLPTAYLLAQRRWWAVLIPLATSLPLVPITPPLVYPIVFFTSLLALLATRPLALPAAGLTHEPS